jgi:hypothetical protein
MTPSNEDDCLDILQTGPYGDNLQLLAEILTRYFSLETIVEKRCYSKVECNDDESGVLGEVREEFKKEFARSEKVGMNPSRQKYANKSTRCSLPTLSKQSSPVAKRNTTSPSECDY